jgi:hypothetical protein
MFLLLHFLGETFFFKLKNAFTFLKLAFAKNKLAFAYFISFLCFF